VAKDTKKDLNMTNKDAAEVKGGAARPDKTHPDMKKSLKRPGIKRV
jgi:hypothetical protein